MKLQILGRLQLSLHYSLGKAFSATRGEFPTALGQGSSCVAKLFSFAGKGVQARSTASVEVVSSGLSFTPHQPPSC